MRKLATILFLLVFLSVCAFAVTIHVPADQPTIQAGIDAAVDGDTVLVADGIYTGDGNKDIDFTGKVITVISENGAENCIIDCENDGRGFYFHSGESSSSVLSGFKIINGYVTGGWPENCSGGILCVDNSSPIIESCIIRENSAHYGGGFYCQESSPSIINCTISWNSADLGGGICCWDNSSPTIENCTFSENVADTAGGGILCYISNPTIKNCTISGNNANNYGGGIGCEYSSPTIENCTIIGNSANWGGGIYCYESSPTIENCNLSENTADYGGGIFCYYYSSPAIENCTLSGNSANNGGGIFCDDNSILTGLNNIIWANTAQTGSQIYLDGSSSFSCTYSDIQGGWEGEGNIDADPLFVTGPDGDYYLSQTSSGQAVTSPCVDAGDPAYPMITGTTRTDGVQDAGVIDMGYHYNLPAAPPAIENLTITIDGVNVNLSWTEIPDASLYYIYRSQEPYFNIIGMSPYADSYSSEFIDYNAVNEGTYYYRVTWE